MSQLGRQVKYGIGKETTAGTEAAASFWVNQLGFALAPKVTYADNDSAWGVVEKTNDSTITQQWAEGSLNAKLTADASGLILLAAFGSVSSQANADGSGSVYDHTCTINQDITGQTLTFIRKDAISTLAYTLGRIGQWKLDMKLNDYIQFTADVMAKAGTPTTATPAYSEETEFVAKHASVKTASSVANLSSATAQSAVESFTLTVNPNLTTDLEAGSEDPYSFSSQGYDFSFEMECRYNDDTFKDAYTNGTKLAFELDILNSDVTIGTSAHPELKFTAPRLVVTDWAPTEDTGKPMTQKITGTIHYSPSDAYALKAVLTNLTASY